MKLSLQECLAYRKDCSGGTSILNFSDILDLCKASYEAAPANPLYVVLPDGADYEGGIYVYNDNELVLLSTAEKTKYTMEVYPDSNLITLEESIKVGLIWQYLSLKAESIGLGVSQRARAPKKINKIVNSLTNKEQVFLYSVAVQKDNDDTVVQDTTKPLQVKLGEGVQLLYTPKCYENHTIYNGDYHGTPLESAIFNLNEKKAADTSNLYEISQLLWACEGENDHTTHGNRDSIEKNGYGRVHASGCAGYSVYPIILVESLANLSKGAYVYNPIGFSALKRWIKVDSEIYYDHFLQKYSSESNFDQVKEKFKVNSTSFMILLCIDRLKPCSGFMHRKIMDTTNWAEIEAGMALAGLQLQANALGLRWEKKIISDPDNPDFHNVFQLDIAEKSIDKMAKALANLPKNEHLSLKGNLIPTVIFYIK